MTVIAVQLFVAAIARNNGFIQSLNFYGTAMIVMVVSVIIAIAARRLPVVLKSDVTVPVAKPEDRLLSEVVADLLVGFFRLLSSKAAQGRELFVAGYRYVGGWLSVGWTAIAAFYVQHAPAGLQSKLARLDHGIAVLSVWTVHAIFFNRVAPRLYHSYDRLRNRLSVTST